jgi:hypothetical protein
MEGVAKVRISKVRLKNGPVIVRLPDHNERRRAAIIAWVKKVLDSHITGEGQIAGFAFVVWDADGAASCKTLAGGCVPALLMPEFVKNKILAERITDWTLDEVNFQWGGR